MHNQDQPTIPCTELVIVLPSFVLPPEVPEPVHLVTEVLVLVPVEPVVPQVPHELISLLMSRVVHNPSLTLLLGFSSKLFGHLNGGVSLRSTRLKQGTDYYFVKFLILISYLSEYLVAESPHPVSILSLTLHSPGVGEELGQCSFGSHGLALVSIITF